MADKKQTQGEAKIPTKERKVVNLSMEIPNKPIKPKETSKGDTKPKK
jgi:hypothetical protein